MSCAASRFFFFFFFFYSSPIAHCFVRPSLPGVRSSHFVLTVQPLRCDLSYFPGKLSSSLPMGGLPAHTPPHSPQIFPHLMTV
ncbi:hypothetical protein BT67DRAFT_23435 [Trichocladium antarcticum]|uniref:Secreted protein n=1 Tax=Trichocladium antarcticum TaxID=1450529 RepID=A0AAN6UTL3_9PEZI|nr:hypothetical protein BT67DRAFT_23435 [Trichocladium antarcticum]